MWKEVIMVCTVINIPIVLTQFVFGLTKAVCSHLVSLVLDTASFNGIITALQIVVASEPKACEKCKGIPPLVVSLVVSSIKDVHLLKRCRLVSKSWSAAASTALKACTFVLLDEDETVIEDFKNMLVNNHLGTLSFSPFQDFHIIASSFSKPNFTSFVQLTNVKITKFTLSRVSRSRALNEENLHDFLIAKGTTIIDLAFYTNDKEGFSHWLRRSEVKLMAVKRLKIVDGCFNDKCVPQHVEVLRNITDSSPLEAVVMEVKDPEAFISLLTPAVCANLKELEITTNEVSPAAWNLLTFCQMPKMRNLTIDCKTPEYGKFAQWFSWLIRDMAPSVEYFHVNSCRVKMLPRLPKVQQLTFWEWKDQVAELTPRKFPSLHFVELWLSGRVDQYLGGNELHPHVGVDCLNITVKGDNEPEDITYKDFNVFAVTLSRQFPKVTDFRLTVKTLDTSMFYAIYNAFPKLKKLGIQGACNFSSIAGTQISIVNHYTEKGWPTERIPRKLRIFRFADLEELELGSEVVMTNDIIKYCVYQIPHLRAFKFYWNSSLSVDEIQNYLGHLDLVQISISAYGNFGEALEQLVEMMPNCRIREERGFLSASVQFGVLMESNRSPKYHFFQSWLGIIPELPKTRTLAFWEWKDQLAELTPTKFPWLYFVELMVSGGLEQFLENEFQPHGGVECLDISIETDEDDEAEDISDKNLNVFSRTKALWAALVSVSAAALDSVPFNHFIAAPEIVAAPEAQACEDTETEKNVREESFTEIPSLVVNLVISSIKDVRLLKRCRLVSKSWSAAASTVLRGCSFVLVNEDETCIDELKDVLLNSFLGPMSYLPSPFQNFHAIASSFTDDNFTNFVNLASVRITKFCLKRELVSPVLNQVNLEEFLKAKRTTIMDLVIYTNEIAEFYQRLRRSTEIQLTALKRLKIKDECNTNEFEHVEFLKNVICSSRLEILLMEVENPEGFINLLTYDVCSELKEFEITSNEVSTTAWNLLGSRKMPSLRTLTVECKIPEGEAFDRQLSPLIRNVAPSVEYFYVNFGRIKNLPQLPTVRHLTFWKWKDQLAELTNSKFPSLRFVQLCVSGGVEKSLENEFQPHVGVEGLDISIKTDENDEAEDIADKNFNIFAEYLSRQFPNVTDFSLTVDTLETSTFFGIYNSFPKLKKLRIHGYCDFSTIAGAQIGIVNHYMERAWPTEMIPRKISVLSFADLEELDLGNEVTMTYDIITYCIAKIPQLKCFKFYWDSWLSIHEIRDCLGHLGIVEISVSPYGNYDEELRQLEEMMPNCRIRQERDTSLE